MRICGIELKGSEARIVVIEQDALIKIVDSRVKKITLRNDNKQDDILSFKDAILNFFRDYNIDKVAIKQRAQTGLYSGGAVTFKMETLIQLYEKEVCIINPQTIKSKTKNISMDSSTLNNYQIEAYKAALTII